MPALDEAVDQRLPKASPPPAAGFAAVLAVLFVLLNEVVEEMVGREPGVVDVGCWLDG